MKRITRFRKRTWVLLGVVAVIAAMASVGAYAFWTSSGSGNGTATTANPTADALAVINLSAVTDLYPGGSDGFTGEIENNAAYDVGVTGLVPDTSATTGSNTTSGVKVVTSAGTCLGGANFSITGLEIDGGSVPLGTAYQIPAGGTVGVSGTLTMLETNVNQDGCKNASLEYYLRAS